MSVKSLQGRRVTTAATYSEFFVKWKPVNRALSSALITSHEMYFPSTPRPLLLSLLLYEKEIIRWDGAKEDYEQGKSRGSGSFQLNLDYQIQLEGLLLKLACVC